jgi:hypothetical protein
MKYFILPLLVISFAFASCASNETADSKDVNQSKIYQDYGYSWTSSGAYVTAAFRFGGENGTTLKFDDPGAVIYNGKSMEQAKYLVGGAYYAADEKEYSPEHTWKFKDAAGKIYENSFRFEKLEFKSTPDELVKGKNLVIELNRPVNAGEEVSFEASCDTIKSNDARISNNPDDLVYYSQSKQQLIVKPAFFVGFPKEAPVSIWMEKNESKSKLEQPTDLPGEMHFSYQSVIAEIRLK